MPFVTVNGIELHYDDIGEGDPLVLLHGLGSSSEDWEYQTPDFAKKYRVIAPTMRGFGESAKPDMPHSVETWANDVHALLDQLKIQRFHLLGFSMGGAIAFQLAVDHPQRVRSLMILNSQPSFEVDHWRKYMMVLTRVAMARIVGMQRLARYVAKRLFPHADQQHLRQRMIRRHGSNDRASYLSAVNALAGWSVMDQIEKLTMPCLVVAAKQDYTPLSEKEAYVSMLRNARLVVIQDSCHATHVDQSEIFNAEVLGFLHDLDARDEAVQDNRATSWPS